MEIHDIDHEGAMELAGMIMERHGGGKDPEAMRAMMIELGEQGFDPIPSPSHSARHTRSAPRDDELGHGY
jgi:hypothetical protein